MDVNSAEVDALFERTIRGEQESKDAWDAIHALRRNGNREIFDRAAEWCRSDDPRKRDRGAAILCQLRKHATPDSPSDPEWLFRDESYSLIASMIEDEQDLQALDSEIAALGHLYNNAAIPLLLRYLDHPDENIRFAVTCALGHFPNEPESVHGLLKLASDSDPDVRDWAVFGVGVQGDIDSPEIRDALLRALDDENSDVREEAAVGLGKRRDPRMIAKLRIMLDKPEFTDRVACAATTLLGLEGDRPEWKSADYLNALSEMFKNPD